MHHLASKKNFFLILKNFVFFCEDLKFSDHQDLKFSDHDNYPQNFHKKKTSF